MTASYVRFVSHRQLELVLLLGTLFIDNFQSDYNYNFHTVSLGLTKMNIIPIFLALAFVVSPSLSQDTWPITPLNITEYNSLGLITLTPLTTTGPSLTLATPTGVSHPHVASSCTAVPWTISQVAAFTADPTDEVIDYSHVEFYFNDPNAGLESYCERDLPHGVGQVQSPGRWQTSVDGGC